MKNTKTMHRHKCSKIFLPNDSKNTKLANEIEIRNLEKFQKEHILLNVLQTKHCTAV